MVVLSFHLRSILDQSDFLNCPSCELIRNAIPRQFASTLKDDGQYYSMGFATQNRRAEIQFWPDVRTGSWLGNLPNGILSIPPNMVSIEIYTLKASSSKEAVNSSYLGFTLIFSLRLSFRSKTLWAKLGCF